MAAPMGRVCQCLKTMKTSNILRRTKRDILPLCVSGYRRAVHSSQLAKLALSGTEGSEATGGNTLIPSLQHRLQNTRAFSTQTEALDQPELDVLYSKVIVEVKGHDPMVLKSYRQFVCQAAEHLGINVAQVQNPKFHVFRQSILSSVHIYKKHQTQYEERTHFQIFEFVKLTGSTADTFLEYIQRNLPEGTAMKVTKHRLETLPEHLKPPQKEKLGEA